MILRTRTNGHCSHLISSHRFHETFRDDQSGRFHFRWNLLWPLLLLCSSLPSLAEPISTWTFVFRSTESHSVPHCSGCTLGQQDNFPALVLIWLLQSGEFASLRSYNCYNAGAACPVRGVGGNNVTASTQCAPAILCLFIRAREGEGGYECYKHAKLRDATARARARPVEN